MLVCNDGQAIRKINVQMFTTLKVDVSPLECSCHGFGNLTQKIRICHSPLLVLMYQCHNRAIPLKHLLIEDLVYILMLI